MKDETRFCKDIGMRVTDRSRKKTCVWKTDACKDCYNEKLEKVYKKMLTKDIRNDAFWNALNGSELKSILSRKRHQTSRFRFQTRGETFSVKQDVFKVKEILESNPDTVFWIPTRGWRNPLMKRLIEKEIFPLSNARVLASTDVTNSSEEWKDLKDTNWSTMYFGDDHQKITPNGDKHFLCPKTHKGLKGHCAICKAGCFRNNKRVDVHLKAH